MAEQHNNCTFFRDFVSLEVIMITGAPSSSASPLYYLRSWSSKEKNGKETVRFAFLRAFVD